MENLAINGGTPVRTQPFPIWPVFDALEENMLLEVIRSGKWGGAGTALTSEYPSKLLQMEESIAKLQDAAYGVSVVNGTVAITVALQAAGLRPGDEVIIPPYTFIATATAALAYGVIPVFADIEEDTFLIDPDKVELAITSRTKAIMPVHIGGAPANMERIMTIARAHNLKVIEDSAQAIGAKWDGQGVGAIGDIGTFSFQSSKNLNAGEGGLLVTNDKELRDLAWSICNVGRVPGGAWYQHTNLGQNYRMTELQAALLLAQLTRLEDQMQRREANARLLDELLQDIDGVRVTARHPKMTRHAHHLYIFRIAPDRAGRRDKAEIIRMLNAEGIPVTAGYVSLNRNHAIIKAVRDWRGSEMINECPISERLSEQEALWLGQNVLLSDEQAMYDIAAAVRKVLHAGQ
ncbi:DegT/DnrJ/EryC1/StrS family aminotransferase [Paenibacillus solanacearum]|nr:DegT/DnrJ/EryC1/StrS family aminotransferase [Paenibacillus solanacearum]